MNYRAYIYTLALLGALALAAVSGGLFTSSDNVVYAAPPIFDDTGTRSVPENTPPGVNIGDPISATDDDDDGEDNDDIEFGDTLTYSLSGTDAASFDIDPSTGQLITKAPLDFENPHDVGDNADNNTYVGDGDGQGQQRRQRYGGRDDHRHERARGAWRARRADGGVDGLGYRCNDIRAEGDLVCARRYGGRR